MTRRSKLALVTLLAGLLSLVPVSAVSAEDPYGGSTSAAGTAQFHITSVVTSAASVSAPGYKFIEANTVLGAANEEAALVAAPTIGYKFIEANTTALPSTFIYAEAVTPRMGTPR